MNKELLGKPLPAEAVKQRDQSGVKLSYVEGHYVIRTANEVFDFDGWDRQTLETHLVQAEQKETTKNGQKSTKWYVGYTAKVRVIVGAVVRDGSGFGQGIDADLGRAHESAIKEAETDAMKRALMTFGDPFGLALYDKEQTHVEKGAEAKKDPKAATPAKPRKGHADPTAPFGWMMTDILPGEWQLSTVSDKQYKYYQELLAQHGIDVELSPAFRSMVVRTYGLDAEIINKSGGYSFAIEFLKDASDDAIIAATEATTTALANRKPADQLAERVNEVYAGATNGK